jgi:hypothetical protein
MLIIETDTDFHEYLKSLSRHARADYAYVRKHNRDLVYECVPFERSLVQGFMQLWEQQIVRGQRIKWAFGVDYVEELAAKDELMLFRGGDLALHFIQKRSGFWECHPPMYDKQHCKRYLAKYMWFNLIKYAMDHQLGPLDMGGGIDDWREMIRRKEEFPYSRYKFRYVPVEVQKNPDLQPNYKLITRDGQVFLEDVVD